MVAFMESTPEALLGALNEVERKNAPSHLFLAGDTRLLVEGRRVSVVGSREASTQGLERARVLTNALVRHGITVVSGLAEGIDTMAHKTAIAAGGRTIAVLGTALDSYFPAENRALQDAIAKHHLLVSQFAAGTKFKREFFPQRNRTMALVSDATIIVEAGEKSGTVHQGWEALRLGRPLYLMESLAGRSDLTWPKEMLRYGAQLLSRETLDAILEEIPGRFGGEVTL